MATITEIITGYKVERICHTCQIWLTDFVDTYAEANDTEFLKAHDGHDGELNFKVLWYNGR